MQVEIEQALISRFVIKDKQERYLSFIAKKKNRKKFTSELYHFNDFNWKLFNKITSNENERALVSKAVINKKHISICYIISANSLIDGKTVSVEEAIENYIGQEGTILVFGELELVYYEAEAFEGRYISI